MRISWRHCVGMLVLSATLLGLALPQSVQAFIVPRDFVVLVPNAGGVTVYKKNVRGGSPDYVTVVNMTKGTFTHFHGDANFKKGDKRGAAVAKKPFKDFVATARGKETRTRKLVAVVNGSYFFTNDEPARLSFGLKAGGQVVSYGSDLRGYEGLYRTLAFKSDRANIQEHGNTTFNDRTIPDVVGGLDPTAKVDATNYRPRTFIGICNGDGDRDGTYETVFLYSSKQAKPSEATKVLTDFGANPNKIIQLDGGGSGALYIVGPAVDRPKENYSGRNIPHVIAVYAGK